MDTRIRPIMIMQACMMVIMEQDCSLIITPRVVSPTIAGSWIPGFDRGHRGPELTPDPYTASGVADHRRIMDTGWFWRAPG